MKISCKPVLSIPLKWPDMPKAENRILGYDLARALALLFMLPINFWVLMDVNNTDPEWLVSLLGLIQGRAAASFVVLAGVGLSLLTRRTSLYRNKANIRSNRNMLLRRALFLFVLGLLNSIIWPSDILHFYAFYFTIGICLVTLSNRQLCLITIIPIVAFSTLMFIIDFDRGSEWGIIDYEKLWEFSGMIRHIFFIGQYPVFPWISFLILGMWLGRQELHKRALRKKILLSGLCATAISESFSQMLFQISASRLYGLDFEKLLPWFSIDPWEPMPLFLISAGGTSLAFIVLSIILSERYGNTRFFRSFVAVGQLSLTLYVAHIVFGVIIFEAMELLERETYIFTVWGSILFYMIAMLFSTHWRKHFKKGPLEWLMRRFFMFHIPQKNAKLVRA